MTQIFRFFTQSDVEVNNCYMRHYSQVFGPVEVQMMLSAFSNIETVHIAAYSHLLDTIGMPEVEYSAFLQYKEMKDKFDYMQNVSMQNPRDIAKTMAMFGAFTEGLALFASFAILMNFPRFNKMKGMGQIVTWSVRDETLHCLSMIRLFNSFIAEHPGIWDESLKKEITESCEITVAHEDAFIDLCFEMGEIEGLKPEDIKKYIRYIGDRRLQQLGLNAIYGMDKNPLPWMDQMLNGAEHTNFFENRATEYSKASTQGSWEDVFGDDVFSGTYGHKAGNENMSQVA
jgi:ribonucleoside-diphosphate reductase beta chain